MFTRKTFLVIAVLILCATGIYVASLFFDPVINYYGNRMRESQFNTYLQHTRANKDNSNFGLYCKAEPLTNLAEQSICFDTNEELQRFLAHEFEYRDYLQNGVS